MAEAGNGMRAPVRSRMKWPVKTLKEIIEKIHMQRLAPAGDCKAKDWAYFGAIDVDENGLTRI